MPSISPWTFPIALVLLGTGRLWLMQARRAKQTGVTGFTGQWPDNFARGRKPWTFHYTVFLYSLAGWLSVFFGAVLLLELFLSAIPWLVSLFR
jgi:hypothetical protein